MPLDGFRGDRRSLHRFRDALARLGEIAGSHVERLRPRIHAGDRLVGRPGQARHGRLKRLFGRHRLRQQLLHLT